MSNWLLDTNVLSELRRKRPDQRVLAFLAARPIQSLYVSSVTLAEIRFGIEAASDPARRGELLDWLANRVRPMFEGRVLAVTEDVLLRWRVLVEEGRRAGKLGSQPDLLIAATALLSGATVVTRDVSGFARTQVSVVNPWRPES